MRLRELPIGVILAHSGTFVPTSVVSGHCPKFYLPALSELLDPVGLGSS